MNMYDYKLNYWNARELFTKMSFRTEFLSHHSVNSQLQHDEINDYRDFRWRLQLYDLVYQRNQ